MATIGNILLHFGVDTKDLKRAEGEIRKSLKVAETGAKNATKSFDGFQRSILAVTGAAVGLHTIGASIRGIVIAGTQFDRTMNTVKGVARATTEEFKAMRKVAKDLGATTEFTATQAAEGLQFLSMAGFSAKQSMEALPVVLDLATASGVSLARSADIASNALTSMGLPVSDLTRVGDTFVSTFTRANVNMEMLAESFKFAAPVASGFGVSIEELNAYLGALGNAGLQGSMAGRGLAIAIQKASDVFEKAGINGTGKTLLDALKLIEEQGWSSTEVMDVFGDISGKAALSLLKQIDTIEKLTVANKRSSGELKTLSDIMRNDMKGAIDEFNSAIEAVKLDIWERYAESTERGLRRATKAIQNHKTEVLALLDTMMFVGRIDSLGNIVDKMQVFGQALQAAKNPAALLNGEFRELMEFIITMPEGLRNLIGRFAGLSENQMKTLVSVFTKANDRAKNLQNGLDGVDNAAGNVAGTMEEVATSTERAGEAIRKFNEEYANALTEHVLPGMVPGMEAFFSANGLAFGGTGISAAPMMGAGDAPFSLGAGTENPLTAALKGPSERFFKAGEEQWRWLMDSMTDGWYTTLDRFFDFSGSGLGNLKKMFSGDFGGFGDVFKNLIPLAGSFIGDFVGDIISDIMTRIKGDPDITYRGTASEMIAGGGKFINDGVFGSQNEQAQFQGRVSKFVEQMRFIWVDFLGNTAEAFQTELEVWVDDPQNTSEMWNTFVKKWFWQMTNKGDGSFDLDFTRFQKDGEVLADTIERVITAIMSVEQVQSDIVGAYARIGSNYSEDTLFRQSIEQANKNIIDIAQALDNATDPADVVKYSGELTAAIEQRYQMELANLKRIESALNTARASLERLQIEASRFQTDIANRLSGVTGDPNYIIGDLARRLQTMTADGTFSIGEYQQLPGMIDEWLRAQEQLIQMDSSLIREYTVGGGGGIDTSFLEEQVAAANAWANLADTVQNIIDDLKFGTANPDGPFGRLSAIRSRIAEVQAAYASSTGVDRVARAQELAELYRTLVGIGGDMFQFPSDEYRAIYDEALMGLEDIQDEAVDWAEKQARLQEQLLAAQNINNAIMERVVRDTSAMDARLADVRAQARDFYLWTQQHGGEAFDESITAQQQRVLDLEGEYGSAQKALVATGDFAAQSLAYISQYSLPAIAKLLAGVPVSNLGNIPPPPIYDPIGLGIPFVGGPDAGGWTGSQPQGSPGIQINQTINGGKPEEVTRETMRAMATATQYRQRQAVRKVVNA